MAEKIFVTQAALPPFEEYAEEIKEIWDSHWLTNMGVKHQLLAARLKKFLAVDNLELLVNGHMSLELSLQALDLAGEVITTPFTFASTTHAIVRNGLTPVFCDIRPDDYTIDVEKLEPLITEKTCALMPVHVYGNVCQVEAIEKLAEKYKLKVVYDAAHAFGVTYKGRGIASFGDVSCFSFHATKVFNTIEGGAACYKDRALGKRLYNLKNFGIRGTEQVEAVGANAKMNEFAAAMGICNLRHLEEQINKRCRVVERYRNNLEGLDGLVLNVEQKDVVSNYAYFPVVIEPEKFGNNREGIMDALAARGIFARKYFYPLISDFACYKMQYGKVDIPVARYIGARVMTLPLYGDLELAAVDEICQIVKAARC